MQGASATALKSLSRVISFRFRTLLAKPGRPPLFLLLAACVVAAALLLSPGYLLLRTLGVGTDALDLLLRVRVLEILGRTLLLVVVVTGAGRAFSAGGDLEWIGTMVQNYEGMKNAFREAGDIV